MLDGYDAATKIRALEKSMMDEGHQVTPLPIVAVSANSIAAKPKCMAVGMQVSQTVLPRCGFACLNAYSFVHIHCRRILRSPFASLN